MVVSNTESNAWTLTLKRTGPLGDEPTLGRYACVPLMTMLSSRLGKHPVTKVNVAGSVATIRSRTEPLDLKPVSASGLRTTVLITRLDAREMTVTRPSLPSSRPCFSATERVSLRSSDRKWVT